MEQSGELIRVNIHYSGKIPILNIVGPIYNTSLSRSMFILLSQRYPFIRIRDCYHDEILEEEKKQNEINNSINANQYILDAAAIITKANNIIEKEVIPTKQSVEEIKTVVDSSTTVVKPTVFNFKMYSDIDLEKLTNKQLKTILNIERNHIKINDHLHGKYQELRSNLIKKIKAEQ